MYYQLGGGHETPALNGLRLDWAGVLATTTQDEPDFRIFQFLADPQNSSYNPEVAGAQPTRPTRFWRDLTEENVNVRADLTLPLPSYNSGENALKGGVALSESEREYEQRGFQMVRAGSFGLNHPFYDEGDPNSWVSPENLQYINYLNFPVNLTYSGQQTVEAGYLMADWAALNWLQLIGGVRYETTDLSISGFNQTRNQPLPSGQIEQGDLLPALSAKVQLRENIDVRAAWSQTIVRPTYREIAEVPIYDVTRSTTYIGNSDLVVSESENYDLRFSWYPRPGEIVSVSVFAKKIKQPIEQSSITIDDTQISYDNFDEADVLGFEGEVRMGLDRLWQPLKPFTVGFNAAYIESEVPLTEIQKINRQVFGDTSTKRPLYNQPEYILNGDLTWELEATRTTVTLSGGVVGESLVLVGLARPDKFLQPAPELNLFVRQKLGKNWDVRLTARNLLNPKYQVAQTWPSGDKVVLESYTKGITFGISVGCEF
jgi:TonB-dependent receptor